MGKRIVTRKTIPDRECSEQHTASAQYRSAPFRSSSSHIALDLPSVAWCNGVSACCIAERITHYTEHREFQALDNERTTSVCHTAMP